MVHADIRGHVNGDICGAGRVRVASTGSCRSRILADYLEVAGEVRGAVEARRLVVLTTGRVHGGARFKSLFIQPGGVLEQGQQDGPPSPRADNSPPLQEDCLPLPREERAPPSRGESQTASAPPRRDGPVFQVSY